jgi:hypothetical protein
VSVRNTGGARVGVARQPMILAAFWKACGARRIARRSIAAAADRNIPLARSPPPCFTAALPRRVSAFPARRNNSLIRPVPLPCPARRLSVSPAVPGTVAGVSSFALAPSLALLFFAFVAEQPVAVGQIAALGQIVILLLLVALELLPVRIPLALPIGRLVRTLLRLFLGPPARRAWPVPGSVSAAPKRNWPKSRPRPR